MNETKMTNYLRKVTVLHFIFESLHTKGKKWSLHTVHFVPCGLSYKESLHTSALNLSYSRHTEVTLYHLHFIFSSYQSLYQLLQTGVRHTGYEVHWYEVTGIKWPFSPLVWSESLQVTQKMKWWWDEMTWNLSFLIWMNMTVSKPKNDETKMTNYLRKVRVYIKIERLYKSSGAHEKV